MLLARTTRYLVLAASVAFCQPVWAVEPYAPKMGQPGKDVIWVPTPDTLVEKMLDMAKVTARDYVVDLGSGDGRTVIAAARRGATAVGIEYNADMIEISRRNAQAAGVTGIATFIQGDIFAADFSRATVVTMYLLSSLNLRLRPTLLKMRPGTRLVSHAFTMAEWMPDQTASIDGYSAYLWIVPAQVRGRWEVNALGGPIELEFEQKFQKITGKAEVNGREVDFRDSMLSGDQLSFTLPAADGQPVRYRGIVKDERIEGTLEDADGRTNRWSARRSN